MAGLKLSACFWYLDPQVSDDVLATLKEGKFDVHHFDCKEREKVKERLSENPPDVVISDFDLPDSLRKAIEEIMEPFLSEIPLIYLVGERNARRAAHTLKSGIWDFVQKEQLYKLVPSVYSSQKYTRLFKKRKEAEQALTESRDRYMSIFNSVSDGILLFDFNSRQITDYNPRVLEIFGLSDKDMENLDLNLHSALDEGYTMDRAREYIQQAMDGDPVSFEWRNIKKSGERIWTLNSISVVKINNSPYILLVTRTIDEQKKLERSLIESQEHFRALAENSPDVIMHFDRQHRHLYVNSTVVAQTGLSADRFINKSHREIGIFPKDQLELWEQALEEVFRTGKPRTLVFDMELADRITTYEWRLYPELGTSEAIGSVIGVARDITESRNSEDALRKSEERLNLALSATDLGLWDWNLATGEVYYSPIWCRMLGYEPDELTQELETLISLLHPEDKDKSNNTVREVIKNREDSFDIEFRLRHKNDSWVWIRSQGKAVSFDADCNTVRLTGTHEDINERKRGDLVRQVLFDISNAVNNTHSLDELYGLIRKSLGRVVDTTNCFLALYNEESDTLTLPFMEDEKDAFTEFPARKTLTSFVIRTGGAQLVDIEREKELTRKGDIEPVGAPCVSWLGVPLKHEGKTIGVFAVQSYTDQIIYTQSDAELLEFASDQIALAIDRRRHQDRIRLNQERQRRVFESSPDPMIVVDPGALIQDFNSAFLEAFNVKAKLVYGQKIFRFIDKSQWRTSIKDFYKTWETGYLKNLEYQVVRPDGLRFDAEVSTGAIYSSDGKPESMVLILKDISKRKEAERSILEAKYKAEESDKLKTAFLSNMSHEIRTPMNAIVGFSDLLTDEQLSPEERRDFIAQINQGADDLMRLIDDIIDIAKIEAGQVNVHIAECFVRELFKELHLMFLQNVKRSGKENVSIRIQWDWPLNELAIYTDPFRLKQILVNLLSNAVKFTEDGEIVLGMREDPEGVYFYVKDSGIGIREEKQKVIFHRFMQGHETKTKLYGGTGLGLAISKNLTEILGGEIGVHSRPGEGSTFWFTLPRNEVPLKYEAALRTPSNNLRLWEDKKVLIAEDDHSNYYFLFEALKETGIQVVWSKDGEETMELFRKHQDLDLVLMDINMPHVNGYDCTRMIKKERPGLPVIAQTAYAMSGEREISREASCDDYLVKPIKVSELLDTMARHI
ncbi:MAG: PAS domain S-box protein [Bacteroidales bacterium]|nr:PAS domain S-box protein [Bacteroidales bacterium]